MKISDDLLAAFSKLNDAAYALGHCPLSDLTAAIQRLEAARRNFYPLFVLAATTEAPSGAEADMFVDAFREFSEAAHAIGHCQLPQATAAMERVELAREKAYALFMNAVKAGAIAAREQAGQPLATAKPET